MDRLAIIKTGSTFPATLRKYGDFEEWIRKGLDVACEWLRIVDVEHGDLLPEPEKYQGIVIAGSHAMVTDDLSWIRRLAAWVPGVIKGSVPLLGICFGHQLVAQAMGGEVGYNPAGKEIGTVEVTLLPECADDPLFSPFPRMFPVHATHAQTVLRLPAGAVRLATNDFEANHAFRLGRCAWGVQFHPEFDRAIMESYLSVQAGELRAAGHDVSAIGATVRETPLAGEILRRFALLTLGGLIG